MDFMDNPMILSLKCSGKEYFMNLDVPDLQPMCKSV